jgi:hypothetical protein
MLTHTEFLTHVSKSFAAWLKTDDSTKHIPLELAQRLGPIAQSIDSQNELLKRVKERYPSHYSTDWRVVTGMPYSREAMRELWAAYLAWAEGSAS